MIKVGDGGVAGTPVTDATSEAGTTTVIDKTAHGLKSGATITIASVTGASAQDLVGTYKVDVINQNVFTVPVATTGAGTALHYTPLTQSYTSIKACKDITMPSAATDEIDITTHDSTGKEFMDGDTDYGEVGFDINYDPSEPTHVLLQALSMSKDRHDWQAVMTDDGAQMWAFQGWVKTFTLTAPVSGVYSAAVAIRVTGAPAVS